MMAETEELNPQSGSTTHAAGPMTFADPEINPCCSKLCCGYRNMWTDGIEQPRNLIAFFFLGLLNNFSYVVMLSAAEDMLQGYSLPAGAVLMADILPTLVIKLTAPFFMHKIPYRIRVITFIVLAFLSFHCVAWFNLVGMKFFGVVLASISAGGGEITYLARSSYYHRNTISTWSSGTGGAGLLGAVGYLALRSWFGLSDFVSLLVCSPLPLLMILCYFCLLTPPTSSVKIEIHERDTDTYQADDRMAAPVMGGDVDTDQTQLLATVGSNPSTLASMTFKQRVQLLRPLLRFMIPLFLVYYGEYVINQGISPAILYDWPFQGTEYYIYYQALYQTGVFLSRSSVNLVPIRRVWIPSVLQLVNALILFFHVWFNYIPTVFIVFVIILWEGLLGGATYVNSFYCISQEFEETETREFALGVTSVADSFGITLAALTSIFIGPVLKQHAGVPL